jgi:maltose O-acetyltransferase
MIEEEKIFEGKLFDARTKELRDIKHKAHILCQKFNLMDEYDHVMFGPNVSLMATTHPLIAEERIAMTYKDGHVSMSEYAEEIHIGNNVWIACNVVVCGGVHIGDNAVIGAGSIVTKDIPQNYLAYGVPCKPVRLITNNDSKLNLL